MAWADVPMGTSFSQRDIEEHGWEGFPHMQEAKAAFERRMLNKRPLAEPTADPQAGADAPEEGPTVADETVVSPGVAPMATDRAIPAGAELAETPPVKASPAQPLAFKPLPTLAFQAPTPPQMPGCPSDPIPSKLTPKLPRVQPCNYTDVRLRHSGLTAGAVPQLDADAAAREQAARLEAAQRAARQAEANAPARDKPFTAQGMEFYIKGQQSVAGVGQKHASWAPPPAFGAGMGKGKPDQPIAHDADPFHGMVAGWPPMGKGKGKGKGKEGKKGKGGDEDEKREPMPCTRCGSFFVCRKAAIEEGKGNGREHCTNPVCERSLHFALLSPEQQRLLLAANLASKEAAAAEARLAATRAEMAAVDAAALPKASPAATPAAWQADATVVIDDTQHSPLTPADAAAAAGNSDTDVSSSDGQPTNPAAWAHIGAYGKSGGPPTRGSSHVTSSVQIPMDQVT